MTQSPNEKMNWEFPVERPSNRADGEGTNPSKITDTIVFIILEGIGSFGLIGNLLLLTLFYRYRHFQKPSFLLIGSLAWGDVLHSVITTSFFYPPIAVGSWDFYPAAAVRVFNTIDWTAWGITLTHMAGICVDRFLAVTLIHNYNEVATTRNYGAYVAMWWFVFVTANVAMTACSVCCPMTPLPGMYTFDYNNKTINSTTNWNVYQSLYLPLEICCVTILLILTPSVLLRLFYRYRVKANMRQPAEILVSLTAHLANSGSPGATTPSVESDVAAHPTCLSDQPRQNMIKEVKVFIQIISVTIVFLLYMLNYYAVSFAEVSNKWWALLNSIFYTITHIINPIVYLLLNDQIHGNLKDFCSVMWRRLLGQQAQRKLTERTPLMSSLRSRAMSFSTHFSRLDSTRELSTCNGRPRASPFPSPSNRIEKKANAIAEESTQSNMTPPLAATASFWNAEVEVNDENSPEEVREGEIPPEKKEQG